MCASRSPNFPEARIPWREANAVQSFRAAHWFARFRATVPSLTSDTIQKLEAVPSRLLVLGAGYIGLEFAQMMHRFGSKVTVLERGGQILSREDADVAEALANYLRLEVAHLPEFRYQQTRTSPRSTSVPV